MSSPAIEFYREHPRAVEALAVSRCFNPAVAARVSREFLRDNAALGDLVGTIKSFNVFSAMGVDAAEVRHSRFLSWLLNPHASHGAGEIYLRAFLRALPTDRATRRLLESDDVGKTEVHCEFDRIDFRIVNTAQRFVCVVENKLRIDEGEGQLRRYREVLEKKYPDWHRRMVFLTLKNDTPADVAWVSLSYASLLEAVLRHAGGSMISDRDSVLALLLEDYRSLISEKLGSASQTNIFEVLHLSRTELKHSHFLAWLLRPNGSHGLADAFARHILGVVEKRGVSLPATAKDIDLADAVVRREWERIDIVLVSEQHRLVLAIENKITARESKDQLANYDAFLRKHYSGDNLIRIFLDLKGTQATHSGYVSIGYAELLSFFDATLMRLPAAPVGNQRVVTLITHYAALLQHHLWIKRKTVWELPVALQEICEGLGRRHAKDVGALLGEVKAWQKGFGRKIEGELYKIADHCFGQCFRFTWELWYSFVPPVYDEIAALRSSGGDMAFDGRLLIYQFFVVPFGDSASVRRPGIFLDVKLIKASKSGAALKAKLHAAALLNPIFNRVRNVASIPRNDPLLNFEVCAFEEAVSCESAELRRRIAHRMERFSRSIHPTLVAFFKTNAHGRVASGPLNRRKRSAVSAAG